MTNEEILASAPEGATHIDIFTKKKALRIRAGAWVESMLVANGEVPTGVHHVDMKSVKRLMSIKRVVTIKESMQKELDRIMAIYRADKSKVKKANELEIKFDVKKRINWDHDKIVMLEKMIAKGYNIESIANRFYTTQSSIRSAVNKHTKGLYRIRSEAGLPFIL